MRIFLCHLLSIFDLTLRIALLAYCFVTFGAAGVSQAQAVKYSTVGYASYQYNTLRQPTGLAMVAGTNYLYIADGGKNVIRVFTISTGSLSTLAGNGTAGYVDSTNPLTAEFNRPSGISGGYYSWIQTICPPPPVPGTCSKVTNYYTKLYVTDSNNYVVRVICTGNPPLAGGACNQNTSAVTTLAGNHVLGFVDGAGTSAEFGTMGGITSGSGYLIADSQNHAIRSLSVIGANVTTFAGTGQYGFTNGYRTSATFNAPGRVATDSAGNTYVADAGNNVIRRIDTAGNVTTFAGNGTMGKVDGSPTVAEFNHPMSIIYNAADSYLYVADSMNSTIRRVDLSGNVSTYAGSPGAGLVNGTTAQAKFNCPMDLLIIGNYLYISDTMNNVIRRIDMVAGTVSTYIS